MKLTGTWEGWTLTNGVLSDPDGFTYQPDDIRRRWSQTDLANEIGVSVQAIIGRVKRGTLPKFDVTVDGTGYWHYGSIKHLMEVKEMKEMTIEVKKAFDHIIGETGTFEYVYDANKDTAHNVGADHFDLLDGERYDYYEEEIEALNNNVNGDYYLECGDFNLYVTIKDL